MREQTFTVTVRHDDSLFPDEGALRRMIEASIRSPHYWVRGHDALTIEVEEVSA